MKRVMIVSVFVVNALMASDNTASASWMLIKNGTEIPFKKNKRPAESIKSIQKGLAALTIGFCAVTDNRQSHNVEYEDGDNQDNLKKSVEASRDDKSKRLSKRAQDRLVVRSSVFCKPGLTEKESRKKYGRTRKIHDLDGRLLDGCFDFCVEPKRGRSPKYPLAAILALDAQHE